MEYQEFIEGKLKTAVECGFDAAGPLNDKLYPFQSVIVKWALRIGKAAVFADCGLGKTPIQLEWARHVVAHTGRPVLIFAPLAVSSQTVREGQKFGIEVTGVKDGDGIDGPGIYITNYERLHRFDLSAIGALVLDESSILKSYSGKFRTEIIEQSESIPYKLCCTATPAPNDYMELGNHAEFLDVTTRTQMLSRFFVHDGGETQKWRLKGHARTEYWRWLTDWAVMIRSPEDLGYRDNGFKLPPLRIHEHVLATSKTLPGELFPVLATGLKDRLAVRRETISERVRCAADIANATKGPVLVWCNLNEESRQLTSMIDNAVEVKGADKPEHKESALLGFSDQSISRLVSKPLIAGFGMNFQHCSTMIFVGLSDSYEQYYQAVRRCWRFGQTKPVDAHIVTSEQEGAVVANIKRKEADAMEMAKAMVENMSDLSRLKVRQTDIDSGEYHATERSGADWRLINGDCVEETKKIPDESIGYSIFSPPFADLYTYSSADRDMGNAASYGQFFEHFTFLITELHRATKPGRLCSIHCMDLPAMKERDGYIGVKDFPGDIIRAFQAAGWIYHSRVTIWKNPLIEATRTKALGLMHKQLCKDSAICRQGLPDYVITMRKPGVNADAISQGEGFQDFIGEDEPTQQGLKYSHEVWRRYASPVWMDINQTRTLNKGGAREEQDEKHICPLQLDTIERCIELWSNPGDTVLSPFAGIGSEGYIATKKGRRFIGIELKGSYYQVAVANIQQAAQPGLFDDVDD